MNTNDGLSYAARIDTSEYDAALDHMAEKVGGVTSQIEQESARIQQLISSSIPEVDLKFLYDDTPTLNAIGEAYAQIARVIRENNSAVNELQEAYRQVTEEANKYANVPGRSEYVKELRQQRKAIQEVITTRKEVIAAAQAEEKELQKNEKSLVAAANAAEKQSTAAVSLRQRIRELTMEAAALRDAEQAQGREIDKTTGRYREIIEEIGRLKDIQGDIQSAGNVFANDENQFAGIISGLTGLSGAFSAAQGAVGLFAGENEHLQEIMLKVQSLMAITMGLQQVQQTLNKDSAFSLVTLNAVKQKWNKLTGKSAASQTQEATATASATAAQNANTTATAENATVTKVDTAAQQENNAVTTAGAGAQATNTSATKAATTAQNAHTGALVAGTAASKAMSIAMRVLKLALISTGIGALVVLVGELVSWIVDLCSAEDEAVKHTQDLNKINEDAAKTYIQEQVALEDNIKACKNFTGSKEQEKKKVNELNSKYGEALGYYDSLEQWERVLTERGPAYCEMLRMKAVQQGLLNKYVEAYVEALEVAHKAENGEFDRSWYNPARWFGDSNEERRANMIAEANKEADYWKEAMTQQKADLERFQKENHFDVVHIDPKSGGNRGSGKTFDPKAAAREQRKLLAEYQAEVKKYITDTNNAISQAMIDSMEAGYGKELATIRRNGESRKKAWEQQLIELAEAMRDNAHAMFMTQNGATEDTWENSAQGKRSLQDWIDELLKNKDVAANYSQGLADIANSVERQLADVRTKYMNQLIDEFGSYEDRFDKLTIEWTKKINQVAAIAPDMLPKALDKMEEAFSSLKAEDFKKTINWDVVFGDLGNQSLQSLQYSLEKVKTYFDREKASMSVEQIKTFQEAITAMENEIASRNPFTALHKSFKDISTAKDELVAALAEVAAAQTALNEAEAEYNAALQAKHKILGLIETGELAQDCQELADANERVTASERKFTDAKTKSLQADQRALNARNNVTKSYKTFATQLKSAGTVVTDIGGRASKLARIFSSDIADSMDKALGFIDEVVDAAGDVISAIGDVGKSVSKNVAQTAEAAGTATQATAQATATSISTVEKASIILTVISAALQIATAIASLFNDDESKQKEIERLQERIDQLQWELDNADTVRFKERVGDAVKKLNSVYRDTTEEVLRLHLTSQQYANCFNRAIGQMVYRNEIYEKSIQKLADAYASVGYTADKALGGKKYEESRKQIENLAEQQILIQRQINQARDKKDTDNGKIEDWQRQIQEIAHEMATIINEMLEDIIGGSSEDISKRLGDAFMDAAAQGEDAMEAWHSTVKDIIADITKRMLISKFIEEPIGQIFDKYKTRWFGSDGRFKGIDNVINSMNDLSSDLNEVGSNFQQVWNNLPDDMKKWFAPLDDAEREGTQKGIATASQDSVDENNARLSMIQEHTYTLVQGVKELNATGTRLLEVATGIKDNTEETNKKLDDVKENVKAIKDSVDEIDTRGLKLRT